MRLSTSKHWVGFTGCFLVVALDLAQGQGLPNNPYSFEVPSGDFFHVSVAFQDKFQAIVQKKAKEVAMSFWREDRKNNENYSEWPGCGNYDNTHRRDYQSWNVESSPIKFAFNMGYKDTPPDVNSKWHFGPGVIESETTSEEARETMRTTVISYPDAKITLQILNKRKQ